MKIRKGKRTPRKKEKTLSPSFISFSPQCFPILSSLLFDDGYKKKKNGMQNQANNVTIKPKCCDFSKLLLPEKMRRYRKPKIET